MHYKEWQYSITAKVTEKNAVKKLAGNIWKVIVIYDKLFPNKVGWRQKVSNTDLKDFGRRQYAQSIFSKNDVR